MRRLGLKIASLVLVLGACFLFPGCENTTFQSSVPSYPVRVNIDTKLGPCVHFQPTSTGDYIIANKDGYFYNGNYVLPFPVTDAYGYGGVLVYVDLFGYAAYDLACPNCAARGKRVPCFIDGIYAVCPECGEMYDVASGSATPQKGLARETLRPYSIILSDGKITVTQK